MLTPKKSRPKNLKKYSYVYFIIIFLFAPLDLFGAGEEEGEKTSSSLTQTVLNSSLSIDYVEMSSFDYTIDILDEDLSNFQNRPDVERTSLENGDSLQMSTLPVSSTYSLASLPNEVLQEVFSFLKMNSFKSIIVLNRKFHHLAMTQETLNVVQTVPVYRKQNWREFTKEFELRLAMTACSCMFKVKKLFLAGSVFYILALPIIVSEFCTQLIFGAIDIVFGTHIAPHLFGYLGTLGIISFPFGAANGIIFILVAEPGQRNAKLYFKELERLKDSRTLWLNESVKSKQD